jgi:hypothetical protein
MTLHSRLNWLIHLFPNAQGRLLLSRIIRCSPRTKILIVTVALSSVWASIAVAACGSSAQRIPAGVFAAQPRPLLQEPAPDGTLEREPRPGDKHPSITGFWKTVYTSGGAVVNVGFNVWHSDGTEWALDSSAPPFQGNTCAGVWEQIGRRTYKTVHPAFNYDTAGLIVVGVFIERVEVTVSDDGSRFEGTFTFDNYDLQGNLLSGSVAGALTATRITVRDPFPFPIPLK